MYNYYIHLPVDMVLTSDVQVQPAELLVCLMYCPVLCLDLGQNWKGNHSNNDSQFILCLWCLYQLIELQEDNLRSLELSSQEQLVKSQRISPTQHY